MVLTGRKIIYSALKSKIEGWGPSVVAAAAQNMTTIFIYVVVIFI